MKKRLLNFLLAMVIIISFVPVISVNAGSYGGMTEESFVAKISSLKNTFVHGKYWNKYNGLGGTGNTSCPCGYKTCPSWCSCTCGAFVYGGTEIAWQCHGYALKIGNAIFGGNPNTWTKVYNTSNVYAGDIARLDNDSHTIFIYKVDGDTFYYTDCNAIGRCMVNWNGIITRNELSNRLSWIYHLSGNTLTGKASSTPTATVPSVSTATVNDGTYTIKNASSGYMMNIYGGNDANGTAVTTWQYDGTADQRIRVAHAGGGKYYLYAACSSSGRVVDVLRGANTNDTLDDGDKIDIYAKGDDPAQLFYIVPVGDGKYVFELLSKDNHVISPTNASAASSNGTQLELKAYNGSAYQQWRFCSTAGNDVDAAVKAQYYLDVNGILDGVASGGIAGYGTCDVYVNGSCVANDVSDYYTQHTQGSTYEIKDIKAQTGHAYGGISSGSISGTLNGNTAVVLKYTTNVYTISYNANGGSGAPSAQTKKHGTSFTLRATKPTREGYTFLGWSSSPSAISAEYQAGGSYTENSNVTLYAVWSANTYTVDFNANGGSVSTSEKTVTWGGTYGTLPTPVRAGYTFLGWYTQKEGGTQITADTKIEITEKQTLYAQWENKALQCSVQVDGSVFIANEPIEFVLSYDGADAANLLIGWDGTGDCKIIDAAGRTKITHVIKEVDSYWARVEMYIGDEKIVSEPVYFTVKGSQSAPVVYGIDADTKCAVTGTPVMIDLYYDNADEAELVVWFDYDEYETIDVSGMTKFKYTPTMEGDYKMQLVTRNDSGKTVSRIIYFSAERSKIDAFYAVININQDADFDVYVESNDENSYSMYIITAFYDQDMKLLQSHIKSVDDSSISSTYSYTVKGHNDASWAKVFVWEKGTLSPLAEAALW